MTNSDNIYKISISQKMQNTQVKLKQIVDAHNRSEITTIISNPYKQGEIITIGHDCFIRVWNQQDLTISRTVRIFDPYLTEIVPFQGKFLLGIGSGSVIVLNQEFQVEREYKNHKDCVTSIVVLPDKIITASYDGDIHIVNKSTFQIQKTLQFHMPINQCLHYKNTLYTASNPSYKIDLQTLQCTKLQKYNQFILHQGQVFASSDQKGVVCLKDMSEVLLPCQYMLSIGDGIFVYAAGSVGTLLFHSEEYNKWELRTIHGFTPGCSILSAVVSKNYIYMTGESGNIYKFKLKFPNKSQQNLILQQIKLSSADLP